MKASEACYDLIRKSEGLRLKAYLCPAGKLTIGYGHTGVGVFSGMEITKEIAETILKGDVEHFEDEVNSLKLNLKQGQFDALIDFCFNLGFGALEGSTLLKKLRAGDPAGAALEFGKWVNATVGGKRIALPGLVARREVERKLFVGG